MLEIKNLSFAVEEDGRQKEILRNLNLTIDNGKFVVITGPNGSGKSTLARLIMGIEKPTAGAGMSRSWISPNGPNSASASPSSSRSASRASA